MKSEVLKKYFTLMSLQNAMYNDTKATMWAERAIVGNYTIAYFQFYA